MTARTRNLTVGLGLLALALLLLKDALFLGGAYYERDLLSIYGPTAQAFIRAVSEGAWPLRDPTTGFGQPLLGNPDAQIPYPPNWLNLFLLPERAYPLIVLFHYVLGAAGVAALAARISRSSAASFFAGAFWLVSGPVQSFLAVWHHLAGAAWMPWVLFAFDRLIATPDRRRILMVGGLFGVQILAGSADMCAMTLMLALLRLICEGGSRRTVGRVFLASTAALVLAACLGAATWLTVLEISRSSLRAALPEEVRTYWSIHPALSAEMVMPLSLGSSNLSQHAKDILYEGREPFVKSVFLGSLAVPLFLGALFSGRIALKYRAFAGIGAFIALLVSFGKFTPVYHLVTAALPPLQIFRYPSKVTIPFALLISLMAGLGVTQMDDRGRRVARAAALVLLVLHAATYLRLHALASAFMDTTPLLEALTIDHLRVALIWASLTLIGFIASLFVRRPGALFAAALFALGFGFYANAGINSVVATSVLRFRPEHAAAMKTPELSRIFVEDYVHFPDRSKRFLGRSTPFEGMKLEGMTQVLAFIVAVRSNLIPPVAGEWGLEYAWDMDLRGLFDKNLREMTIHDRQDSAETLRIMQIANVSRVLALHSSSFESFKLERTVATPMLEPLLVFDVPDTLPRAYAVSGIRIADPAAQVKTVLDPGFDPRREVTLTTGDARGVSPTFQSATRMVSRRSDRIELEATLNEPGAIVLLEGFLPGWRATVDGASFDVVRANAVFLAVPATAGRHSVVFTYRPRTAVVGLALTALTALALAFGLLHRRDAEEVPAAG